MTEEKREGIKREYNIQKEKKRWKKTTGVRGKTLKMCTVAIKNKHI